MPDRFKRAIAVIAEAWKILARTLAAILLALTLAIALRDFPAVRIPAAAVAGGIFLILLLWFFPKWQVRSIVGIDSKDRFDRENEARKTLSTIVGGLFVLIGSYFTWQSFELSKKAQLETDRTAQQNIRIAIEGQITDRFTKAITQLGDTKLEVRLGGIYALDRISSDSPKDHWSIMEVFTAYVREHTKVRESKQTPKQLAGKQTPAPDIHAILTVIGSRTLFYSDGLTLVPMERDDQHLDFQETDLAGETLPHANFSGANFYKTQLMYARLQDASLVGTNFHLSNLLGSDLTGANLTHADLSVANISQTNLTGARLNEANLNGAKIRYADLTKVHLNGANLRGADLTGTSLGGADLTESDFSFATLKETAVQGVDLTKAKGLTPTQVGTARGSVLTKLPPNIPRPKSWQ